MQRAVDAVRNGMAYFRSRSGKEEPVVNVDEEKSDDGLSEDIEGADKVEAAKIVDLGWDSKVEDFLLACCGERWESLGGRF